MSAPRFSIVCVVLASSLGGAAAFGQVQPIDNRVDMRVPDASNLVGSGGYNGPVTSSINTGNMFITGNVTGGRAFRGFSPIRDSSSLLMNLPTSRLSNFQRDSIGVGDVIAGRSLATVSPFYLRSTTATSAGAFGPGSPGISSSAAGNMFAVPRVDLFTGNPLSLNAALNPGFSAPSAGISETRFVSRPRLTDAPVTRGGSTFENLRFADSPLFGLAPLGEERGLRRSSLDTPGEPGYPRRLGDFESRTGQPQRTDYRQSGLSRLLDRSRRADEVSPLPILADEDDAPRIGMAIPRAPSTEPDAARADTGPLAPDDTAVYATGELTPAGQSVYADFRRASQWADRRADEPLQPDSDAEGAPNGGFDSATSYFQRLLDEAPNTFAGQVDSNVNVRLRRAEALMRKGEFYNAADQYAIAASLAPDDPLTWLGQGQAYLAAGDYISAVHYLTRGLERFPEVRRFHLNLYNFVADATILDIRRADLDAKLERTDDYRLRFLLGYVEYYGGLREFGLAQLKRAAEAAPKDSVIARFPDMLTNKPK